MKKTILILLLIGITIGTIVSDVYSKYVLDKSINAVSLEASTLYNIEYNLKGGTISGEPLKYTVNHSLTLPNPIKMGYNFTGWTGENGTLPQTNVIIVKGSIGNKSYTANWKTTNYTISYNLNGGNLATTNNYNIETNTFGLGVPTKTGYTFTGWTGSNGTTPQININIVKGYIGNKSYTANWNVNSYTVTYYNTSGGWYDSRTVNYGSSIPIVDYNAGDWNIFTGWTYSGIAIGNISMPSYNINVNANTREANCQIRTGQATNGDDSRISRFQELVGQKGLGGYWVYTEGLGNSFNSNWSNYSHVMEAANHLLANAGKSSWPYLRYLLLVSETGATRGLR